MFTQGQKVWTPEFGWVRYERPLVAEEDVSFDSKFRKVRTSTIVLDPPWVEKRMTDKQRFLRLGENDPALLEELRHLFTTDTSSKIFWSCGTINDAHLRRAEELSNVAGITVEDALTCINYEDCPKAHDLKAYLRLATAGAGFLQRIAAYFEVEPHLDSWQINSKAATLWLIKELGVLPTKKGRA